MTTQTMTFYSTSIGKKTVMSVTGFILFAFVVVHMIGNLQVYAGPEKLNAYAAFLKKTPALLWTTRLILFFAVVLHAITALQLKVQNWRARPIGYRSWKPIESGYASRNMLFVGSALALFVIYHVLHFTTGTLHSSFNPEDVFTNVVSGFSSWPVTAVYVGAMLLLSLHLYHGVWSMFQSVGLSHPKYDPWRRLFATGITLVLVIGNISMPLSVLISNR